jgi:hypothetical protein
VIVMREKATTPLAAAQSLIVDHDLATRSTDVDRYLAMLRQAIADTGWKHEALAEALAIDKAYLSRLLSGEKPFRVEHLVSLPDDLEARFATLRAESCGLIVVAPVDEATACRHLVSGLIGVLSARPALRMAKAGLIPQKKERRA